MHMIKSILYPTDFSERSRAAIPMVKLFMEKFSAELHVIHVVDESFQYWMAGADSAVPVMISESEIMDTAQSQMNKFVDEYLQELQDNLKTKLVPGRPFLQIIQYAREQDISLIIIPTHGHGALASMLLGSVTEKVVRKAPCPVLTIRHQDYKFEMP